MKQFIDNCKRNEIEIWLIIRTIYLLTEFLQSMPLLWRLNLFLTFLVYKSNYELCCFLYSCKILIRKSLTIALNTEQPNTWNDMQRIHERKSHDAIEIYFTILESHELVIKLLISQQNMRNFSSKFRILRKCRKTKNLNLMASISWWGIPFWALFHF